MHRLRHFKGFKDATIDLFRPFTLLIGPNGSGKSNVIEAIELLSLIAHGRPIHEIRDVGGRASGIQIRGGIQSCPSYGENFFTLGFEGAIEFEGKEKSFLYIVLVRVKPYPRVAVEVLRLERTMIFETVGRSRSATSGDVTVRFNNFAPGGRKPQIPVTANRSVLSQYEQFAKGSNRKYDECVLLVQGIMEYLQASFIFDPSPKRMRSYERVGNVPLARDGSNLSAVLYALKMDKEEGKETLGRLLDWIKQLPDEPYKDFGFVTTELEDVIFGFFEGDSKQLVDARLLSDGTLRSLAILTALETVDEESRVIIEEFDNGLHPSRIGILTDAIESCCERRDLNVLVTTHNPTTLNSLKPEQLDGVVFCTWDKARGSANLITLEDLPRHDELLERGRLGDLVTRRLIEQYLSPGFEERRSDDLEAWLKALP